MHALAVTDAAAVLDAAVASAVGAVVAAAAAAVVMVALHDLRVVPLFCRVLAL